MKIGILGAGRMGGALGRVWAAAGHEICFAHARRPDRLQRLARDTGGACGSIAHTVAFADVLLLAVHWSQVGAVLAEAGDLAGMPVLNCCVPLDAADRDLVIGRDDSGAEWLARQRPRAAWVGCFNTVPSESFAPVFAARGTAPLPQVLLYGEDARALALAQGLIRDAGFEPRPAGGLRSGRFVEPFAMVTAELAYGQPGGPALTYRFDTRRG